MGVRRQPRIGLGDGIALRPWGNRDADALVLAMRDPVVRHYSGRLVPDARTALDSIARWNGGWADASRAGWALVDAGDQVLGCISFGIVDAGLGTGSVGYWLVPEARGRGLAAASVRAATRSVFTRLGWHRIELYHAVENHRSCGVARRCGYPLEGIMREAMQYPVDGRWSDEHLHARLASDPEAH